MTLRNLTVCFALVVLMLAGCGEKKYKVSGTVTFEGKLVETGSIAFEAADGGAGVEASGIKDGKYELQSKIGKKKVIISASRVRPGTEKDVQPAVDSYIPTRYNTESELIKEVIAGDNRFDFDLKK